MTPSSEKSILHELENLDQVIHAPARLMILSILYVVESADFIFLMRQTNLTWGNLSTHLSKLGDAGYVEITKTFSGKRPQTTLRLTPQGRQAFKKYKNTLRQVLDDLPD